MKKSNDLKQLRASKLDAQQAIVDAAQTRAEGQRDFNEDEVKRFDALQTEIDNLDIEIVRAEKFEANQAKRAAANAKPVNEAPAVHRSTKNETFSFLGALRSLAKNKELTGKAAEVNERAVSEMKAQGMQVEDGLRLHIPSDMFQSRSQTVDGNSGADGAKLVSSDPRAVAPLQPNINVLENLGVTVMDGLVGDVPLPTNELFTFGYVGETEDVAKTKVGIDGPTLKPKRVAGVAGVSNKLLRQTSYSVEQMIINSINNAYGKAIVQGAISGAGGNAPTGVLDLITTNIETTAGAPTKAIITALEALVNNADGSDVSRGYLSDYKLANKLKNTLVDAGSGRFLYDGNGLNGYRYEKSTLVPVLNTDTNHPLIFGDWAQMFTGYWGNISILIDPYTLASAGQVKMVIEGYSDMNITNEKAFAVNKVLTD